MTCSHFPIWCNMSFGALINLDASSFCPSASCRGFSALSGPHSLAQQLPSMRHLSRAAAHSPCLVTTAACPKRHLALRFSQLVPSRAAGPLLPPPLRLRSSPPEVSSSCECVIGRRALSPSIHAACPSASFNGLLSRLAARLDPTHPPFFCGCTFPDEFVQVATSPTCHQLPQVIT